MEEVIVVTGRQSLEEISDRVLKGKVVLDFGEVDFIVSTDLGILINLHKRLKATGGELVIRNITPNVKEVIEITKLDSLFNLSD